ncbi:ADAMTS-like protein 1 [Bulinus truncatus]|nr:ADAMTS-like protein 1 [Bulinus truncatus]
MRAIVLEKEEMGKVQVIATLCSKVSSVKGTSSESVQGENNNSHEHSARWEVTETGPCTSPCGGVQERDVRCVRATSGGQGAPEAVGSELCPSPAPELRAPCKQQACLAEWSLGNYSQCSTTCGTGTQTRVVYCMSLDINGHRYIVSTKDCAAPAPETSRKCHEADCPDEGVVSILSENYTLIQFRRSKKLQLLVGGQVKLLPGQTLVVKCPVKNYSKKLINWSKGYRLIPLIGRVKSTFGGLNIVNSDPNTDAGVYTCTAGDKSSNIQVSFINDGDSEWSDLKTWAEQSRWSKKSKFSESTDRKRTLNAEDADQQRDQSLNNTGTLSYVTGQWSKCTAVCGGPRGQIKRKVTCALVSAKFVKIVPDEECERVGLIRPDLTSTCGQNCAAWRPGRWSECQARCGQSGHKSRQLDCVWETGDSASLTACPANSRPATTEPCRSPPCPKSCKDKRKLCSFARLLKMCRYLHFHKQCCSSCKKEAATRKSKT